MINGDKGVNVDTSAIDDLASLTAQSRKNLDNNPLLQVLQLVIENNAEYARGVTAILDSDLERDMLLTEVKKELIAIKKLVEKNEENVKALQIEVASLVEKIEAFDEDLAAQLKEKLKPLYLAADLQDTGASYNPTDKLVVTLQKVLSSKVFTAIGGIILWLIIKFLYEGIKP